MGIESVSGVSSFQAAGAVNAARAVKPVESANTAGTAADVSVSQPVSQAAAPAQISSQNKEEQENRQNGGKEKEPTMKDVKDINKIINNNTIAEFGYNEPTKRITIKIKDKETDEVIKEIPSEKALEMLAKAWELAGILVDEKR
ncbi:MAG: flagellar protein FlaG [Eubacteriales bacterium]|nr:flagellar protein FlaG [Eubacteriales bacterium]